MMSYAYWEGYEAYQTGYTSADNPYYSDQIEWEEWKDGNHDAAQDD